MINDFVYNSQEFRDALSQDLHQSGEVCFLQSITKTGMTVVEGGANKGITTVALAKTAGQNGRVYAFEPVPEYYDNLQDALLRNGVENVNTFKLALGKKSERISFYKREGGSGITSEKGGERLWVESVTLNDFIIVEEVEKIDLLNLDCEGSELYVFEGASEVLKNDHPLIFCEIHHDYLRELGQTAYNVADYLRQFKYEVQPIQVEDLEQDVDLETCSHIYAYPKNNK